MTFTVVKDSILNIMILQGKFILTQFSFKLILGLPISFINYFFIVNIVWMILEKSRSIRKVFKFLSEISQDILAYKETVKPRYAFL